MFQILDLDENSDDRTEYASIQAILYGPCLLAGHTTSDWDIKNVAADSLSEWITPIPAAHNDHLVTVSLNFLRVFMDCFDMVMLKIFFKKNYYFNIFLNKKY